jgi:hypothetical protein
MLGGFGFGTVTAAPYGYGSVVASLESFTELNGGKAKMCTVVMNVPGARDCGKATHFPLPLLLRQAMKLRHPPLPLIIRVVQAQQSRRLRP